MFTAVWWSLTECVRPKTATGCPTTPQAGRHDLPALLAAGDSSGRVTDARLFEASDRSAVRPVRRGGRIGSVTSARKEQGQNHSISELVGFVESSFVLRGGVKRNDELCLVDHHKTPLNFCISNKTPENTVDQHLHLPL